jgi:transcription-repair coupling factor (superfamily II helicase)
MPNIFKPSLPKPRSEGKQAQVLSWGNLAGSSSALAIASAIVNDPRPFVLLTADSPSALRLEQEIRFFLGEHSKDYRIQLFPDWETLPYDHFSPHQDIVSQRLETLFELKADAPKVVILPVNTAMQRLAPTSYLSHYVLFLKTGQTLDIEAFRRQLEQAGYLHVSQVMNHSEFSVRGSIIDLFPMGSDHPFRIDLFDDEIDSISTFNTSDQRSGDKVTEVKLLPAREFPTDKQAKKAFRKRFLNTFDENNSKESVFYQITRGTMPGGVEYYLPLFFDETATVFDYFHQDTVLLMHGDIEHRAQRFWDDIQHRYEQYRYNSARPLLAPERLYTPIEELFQHCKTWSRVTVVPESLPNKAGRNNFATSPMLDIALDASKKQPAQDLHTFLKKQRASTRVVFCAETQGRKENLLQLLKKTPYRPTPVDSFSEVLDHLCTVVVGRVEHSFCLQQSPDDSIAFITETQLLGHQVTARRSRDKRQATDESAIIRNLAELTVGQPVVHLEHGVGRFLGLQTLDTAGITTEFVALEYAKGAKLYVPVSTLHLISRYSGGDADHAPLHTLGKDTWSKAKEKAAKKVRDVAAELLNVYAKRAAKPGYAHKIDWAEYQKFADSFPFSETPDQAQAINNVINDMGMPSAMDRLVCGDVGFGKTEVAMRAAFIAAHHGKQVAILVPTTLLAQQHFENFVNRFSDWPFNIQVLSRFVSAKEQKHILNDVTAGKVDIIVGTHKLLQNDVKFADLGLVIIDEEHRFGVRQKDKFKALRADVDILTLTATPIPRTLNMAMSGMRDLSIIATPPAKRLPIKTFVIKRNQDIIREAIMREILRGGQVYFLHNDIDTIASTLEELQSIVPEARIAIGHGQMRETDLERVMDDFYHQRYNVLLCTTIIETGIDVPSANTIIMDRADHLGLAQLHQLRGRVGRSHHQAYAYLLTPHPRRMTKDSIKRLEAISSLEDLGSGFALATHDLEIRGAGELLGDGQSGQIASVGFSLYMDMLERAVEAIRSGKEPDLDAAEKEHTDVELKIPALLPESYIGDTNLRLSLYKRLASCKDQHEINELQVELIDRFGLLPEPAKHLFQVTEFKLLANQIGIKKIEASASGGLVEFKQDAKIDPGYLIKMIQQHPTLYRFDGPTRLKVTQEAKFAQARIDWVDNLLISMLEEGIAA